MSLGSLTSLKTQVLDILPAAPVNPQPRPEPARTEPGSAQDSAPGFEDYLRDSTPRQSSTSETQRDTGDTTQPTQDSERSDQPKAEDTESTEASTPVEDSNDTKPEAEESSSDQQGGEQADISDQEEGQQVAANAQQQGEQAQASTIGLGLDLLSTQQAKGDGEGNAQAENAAKQQQALAGAAQAKADAAAASKQAGDSAKLDTLQLLTTAPTTQQGAQGESSGSETRSDSQVATALTQTAAANTASTNATNPFAVPDQVTSEARLPIQNAGAAVRVDGGQQGQSVQLAGTSDNDALNTARLTRGLANAVQQRGGAVTLRLTPPEMGTVRIQMQITGTNVSASFHAESASAQTLLTTQLAQLRSSLETQGMNVERLSVQPLASTSASNNANQSQNDNGNQQQGQAQQQGANDGRSRGQYSGSGQSSGGDQQGASGANQESLGGFFDQLNDAADTAA